MPKNVGSIKTWSAKMKSRCSILLSEFNTSKCSLKTNKALWGVTLNLIYSYYISLKNITKRSPKDLTTDAVNWWNLHRGSWSETSCFLRTLPDMLRDEWPSNEAHALCVIWGSVWPISNILNTWRWRCITGMGSGDGGYFLEILVGLC